MRAAGVSKDRLFFCLHRMYFLASVLSVRHISVIVPEAAGRWGRRELST